MNLPKGLRHRVFAFGMAGLYRGTPIPMVPIWRGLRSLHCPKPCDNEDFPARRGDGATDQGSHGTKAKTRLGNVHWVMLKWLLEANNRAGAVCPQRHPQPSGGTARGWGDGTLNPHGLVSSVSITTLFFIQTSLINVLNPRAEPWDARLFNLTSG